MMHRFNWQIAAVPVGADPADGPALLEVSADEVEVNAVGVATFWIHNDGVRDHALASFKASDWRSFAIQSAIDGYISAYRVLRPQPGKAKAR